MSVFHIYSRGVDKRKIFLNDEYRLRFWQTLRVSRLVGTPSMAIINRRHPEIRKKFFAELESNYDYPLLDVLAVCLMDNHYHLILMVDGDERNNLTTFMRRVNTSFTKYFNTMDDDRVGHLFESRFGSVEVKTDEQLVHVVRYVHVNYPRANPELSERRMVSYPWSSLPVYLGKRKEGWINTKPVMDYYLDKDDFWNFTKAELESPTPLLADFLRLEK